MARRDRPDDRCRGVEGGRRVVFVHPDDVEALGHREGDVVDLVSEWTDPATGEATERTAASKAVVVRLARRTSRPAPGS